MFRKTRIIERKDKNCVTFNFNATSNIRGGLGSLKLMKKMVTFTAMSIGGWRTFHKTLAER